MTIPVVPDEPMLPPHPAGSFPGPEPGAPPWNGSVAGGAAGYPMPSMGAVTPLGPFSPIVGRALTTDETTWGMLTHLGGILLGFLAPLIVMLTKGTESPYTRHHAVEALNFQITLAIGYTAALVLSFVIIGIFLFPVLFVVNIVFSILAGLAANKGTTYRYPATLRLVK